MESKFIKSVGSFVFRIVGAKFGLSEAKETPYIQLELEVESEENGEETQEAGKLTQHRFYMTEKTRDRNTAVLKKLGWDESATGIPAIGKGRKAVGTVVLKNDFYSVDKLKPLATDEEKERLESRAAELFGASKSPF